MITGPLVAGRSTRFREREKFMDRSRYLQLYFLCAVLACCTSEKASSPTFVADTPENRRHAAEEYLRVVPPEDLMRDTAAKVGETMPASVRQSFVQAMTEDIDVAQLKDAIVKSMVRHFTVGEINALTAFYGSAEGKSVMKKFGLYMADVMPVIQAETNRAMARAKQSTK
jgi:hypothetical protein